MSNYTGGGRNLAKHRHREPGSQAPSKKPFTSKGIGVHQRIEVPKIQNKPQFDFHHARNTSLDGTSTGVAPSQPVENRIDYVPSDWALEEPKYPCPSSVSNKGTAETQTDPRKRVLERIEKSDLLRLPPEKDTNPRPLQSKLPARRIDASPALQSEHRKRRNSSPSNVAIHPVHDTEIPEMISGSDTPLEYFPTYSNVARARYEQHALREAGAESTRIADDDDEILSFPSTPLEPFEDVEQDIYSAIGDDDFDMPAESSSPNPFLVRDTGGSPIWDSFQSPNASYSSFLEDYTALYNSTAEEDEKSLGDAMLDKWLESPTTGLSTERLRLPGDRTGVGLPLKRWVGDGLEEINDVGLFPTVYSVDSDSDDEEVIAPAKNWLERPYEDHLFNAHQASGEQCRDGLPAAYLEVDSTRASVESEECTLGDVVDIDQSMEVIGPGDNSLFSPTGLPAAKALGALYSEQEYNPSSRDEGAIHNVTPVSVEDEPVFVLAPNIFDYP